MAIKEKMYEDVAVLSITGNLMGEPETTKVREAVYSLLEDDVKKIVLDLKGVKWMNSTGLGCLISCLTSVKSKNGVLVLSNVAEKIESLFMITQLVKVFKTFETNDRAVASFKK